MANKGWLTNEAVVWNEDCIPGMAEHVPDASIDLVVTSIPFGSLFSYTHMTEDIGNSHDGIDLRASDFALHMRFCVAQLARVLKPGRNLCVHIQQLLAFKNEHGFMGRRDFRGAVVDMFTRGGFIWAGEAAIPKNPQVMAQRLTLHSLLFITGKRNACQLAPAMNDYLMIFQQPGDIGEPVRAIYDPRENPNGWLTTEDWISWACGVWNIRETDVLEDWMDGRELEDERHVCPLQLSLIRRCILLYSNPGDVVLDPFMGIGSVAYQAIQEGRRAVGFELKASYHRQAQRNIAKSLQAKEDRYRLPLFEMVDGNDNAPLADAGMSPASA